MKQLPMKPASINTEQINLRIDRALKEDLERLKFMKVDVGNLLRAAVKRATVTAFALLESEEAEAS